jgi:hypothetical protein
MDFTMANGDKGAFAKIRSNEAKNNLTEKTDNYRYIQSRGR